jgi:hypothetical protein
MTNYLSKATDQGINIDTCLWAFGLKKKVFRQPAGQCLAKIGGKR